MHHCLDDRKYCIECTIIDGVYKVYRVAYVYEYRLDIYFRNRMLGKYVVAFFFVSVSCCDTDR